MMLGLLLLSIVVHVYFQKMRASCTGGRDILDPLSASQGIKPKFYDLGPQIDRNPKEPPKGEIERA